jgi:beta-1,4-N-acetylglucosaminyltransferase
MLLPTILLAACAVAVLRLAYLVSRRGSMAVASPRSSPCRTLVVLGSGGHTAEMLGLLAGMSLDNYQPRVYVAAQGDQMSVEKAGAFERQRDCEADVRTIPRARKVRQSYWSSVFSTLLSLAHSCPLVWGVWPDLVLCNGPGTCIPLCSAAYLLKFLGLHKVRLVYVESVCRVQSLSVSGKLLYYLTDHLVVQW